MKVLVSQKVEGIAGAETYLISLLPALKAKGIQVEFLLFFPTGKWEKAKKFEEIIKGSGVTVHSLAVNRIPTFFQLKKIHHIIRFGEYDIVHSNLLPADITFAVIKLLFNKKMVLVSGKHGYEDEYTNLYGFNPSKKTKNFYWYCAWVAEKFINRSFVISSGLFTLYTGLGISKKKRLELIHYGFDFKEDYQINQDFQLGNPQLVIVGRLIAFKGHRYAIEALKKLVPKYPDIQLVIVGWGELKEKLQYMAKEMDLEKHVVFTGFNQNPREIMFNSDIVLLPSVSEGFGIVVLEAMSVKRPVVAFKVPSPSEIFIHNETGLLATPYSVEEYTSLIERLIENPDYRKEIAENAYRKLKDYYNLSRMISQTIGFYERALGKHEKRSSV